MAEERVQRRLAAIMAADVVGFSRLMEADETGTLNRLKSLRRDLFAPKTAEFGGRIFKLTGTGTAARMAAAKSANVPSGCLGPGCTLKGGESAVPADTSRQSTPAAARAWA